MTDITPATLAAFIDEHRRIYGNPPKLRECVEHFDRKLFNVLMCLGEAEAAGLVDRESLRSGQKQTPATGT